MRECEEPMDTRFHCVYLLTSLDPQCDGEYYIGYTVDPIRRLRQHNGELVNGAGRTKRRGRPWELLCCVSGFGEDRVALKFEWCWQHPTKSARLKAQMAQLRGTHRLPHAVGVLHLLLRADLFARLPLTLHVLEPERFARAAAEVRQRVPSLEPLVETPLLTVETTTRERFQREHVAGAESLDGDAAYFIAASALPGCSQPAPRPGQRSRRLLCEEDAIREHAREKELLELRLMPCSLCAMPLRAPYFVRCARTPHCGMRGHLSCLAMWFTHSALRQPQVGPLSPVPINSEKATMPCSSRIALLPRGPCGCPLCDEPLMWTALIYDLKRRAVHERRWSERQRQERMETIWRERLQRIGAGSKELSRAPTKRRRGGLVTADENCRSDANDSSKSVPVRQRDETNRAKMGGLNMHSSANILPLTEFNEEEWLNF